MASRRIHCIALSALLLLYAFTIAARYDVWLNWPNEVYFQYRYWTNEAATHLLSYVNAFSALPVAVHKFLPTANPTPTELLALGAGTLPTDNSAVPAWMAIRLSTHGLITYLSFPPGAFLASWLAFTVSGAEATPHAMMVFNLFLQLVTTGLLYLLIWKALAGRCGSERARGVITVAATATYLLSTQTLHGHMQVIWGNHVFQPMFVGGLLAFFFMRPGAARLALLGGIAFAGVITEWTPWFFNLALFTAALWPIIRRREPPSLRALLPALAIGAGQLAGMLLLVWIYHVQIGLDVYLPAVMNRFDARATGGQTRFGLLDIYISTLLAYGPYQLILLVLGLIAIRRAPAASPQGAGIGALVGVMLFTLVENLVFADHTVVYSYSQMKMVAVMAVIIALVLARISRRSPEGGIVLAVATAAIGGLLSLLAYDAIYGNHIDRATGKRVYATLCLGKFRDSVPHFRALMAEPGLIMTNFDARVDTGPFLGRAFESASSIAAARDRMKRLGEARGTLVVLGGHDFEKPGDALPYGRPSAELRLTAAGDGFGLRLFPARADTPIASAPGRLRFHNAAALALLEPGLAATDESGRPLAVDSIDADGLRYHRTDSGADAVPQRIDLTLPLTPARASAPLGPAADFKESGCKFEPVTGGLLPGMFAWARD